MRPFHYQAPSERQQALQALSETDGAQVLAGGTSMVDLMKLDVMRPNALIDINALDLKGIDTSGDTIRFGALTSMAEAAAHEELRRDYPALTESLWLAASPQLRNIASLAGNVLQRTRCPYFRDTSYPCNKRLPGSGCAALDGYNRLHAVLGTSERCIASYPGDWAAAVVMFDATIEMEGPEGERSVPFEEFHTLPGDDPATETVLQADEIVTAIVVQKTPLGRASTYYKVRDRESYAFANASAAVGLTLDGDSVTDVRIGLGGVASVPWRARAAEDSLRGQTLSPDSARRAGEIAFQDARTFDHNAFKVALGIETVIEALMSAKTRAQA